MTLNNKTIAFIGAGNMAEALIRGLIKAGIFSPQRIIATDVRADRLDFFRQNFGVRVTDNNVTAVAEANIVVLAVKPQHVSAVLAGVRGKMSADKLIISIAAGVPTARIESELAPKNSGVDGKARVVRVMPNTPALAGAGASALAKGTHATEEDLGTAEAILGAVGITVRVEERFMDAVTALSGSGPAYVFYTTEAMIKAGVTAGLDEALAKKLAIQTVYGAAKLLVESGESPELLRRKVTSPGGTTEAALKVMSERKLMGIFAEAVKAAEKRSRELSES
jgi:pyrroline-5-carboxylate reductase